MSIFGERFNLGLECFGLAACAALGLARADGWLACRRCNGKGQKRKGWDPDADTLEACYGCGARGYFPPVDTAAIEAAIQGRKGLRSARPKYVKGRGLDAVAAARAYYVWRMARFHGGVDTRMPMMADLEIGYDPFQKACDTLSDAAAVKYFGSDLRGAMRWGRAMGLY